MKSVITFLILVTSGASAAEPSAPVNHISSTLGAQARYEIIQSSLAARWTFKIDRFCGYVAQLVLTSKQEMTFENMTVLGLPKCNLDGKVRYQLFTSGLAARHTYMLNTETGKAWQIQTIKDKDGDDASVWVAIVD